MMNTDLLKYSKYVQTISTGHPTLDIPPYSEYSGPSNSYSGRIVGGETTSISQHPWQASIQALGFHVCGGSIISSNNILTAGHCTSYTPTWLSARVGSSILHTGGTVYRVAEYILHQDYHMNSNGIPENDIAILVLKIPIVFENVVQPISVFHQGEMSIPGTLANITGWGKTSESGSTSQILRVAQVFIVDKAHCDKAYQGDYGGIPDGQICAAHPLGGRDSCQGDSGGPLVIGNRQAGIVSWGRGCAEKGYPGVYTEIAAYSDWITNHVRF
ncbi:hypothetical protein QAD02_005901 [Eretmocerus hayati]|uniref:Uncharacterized protein n=1 Tax=Eretmocerus hayati TaxID=131215 RepID=A0ACC2MZL3_9HYME|nr:hypothetical protein QAD02_005901 [Eretmocerus hayati]